MEKKSEIYRISKTEYGHELQLWASLTKAS